MGHIRTIVTNWGWLNRMVLGNAAISGVTYIGEQAVQGKEIKSEEFIYSSIVGGVAGVIGGHGCNTSKIEGIWNTSKRVLKIAVSPRKVAMYMGKNAIKECTAVAMARAAATSALAAYANAKEHQF